MIITVFSFRLALPIQCIQSSIAFGFAHAKVPMYVRMIFGFAFNIIYVINGQSTMLLCHAFIPNALFLNLIIYQGGFL